MTDVILPSNDEQKAQVINMLRAFNRSILNIGNDQESNLSLNFIIQDNEKVVAGINANLYFLKSILFESWI